MTVHKWWWQVFLAPSLRQRGIAYWDWWTRPTCLDSSLSLKIEVKGRIRVDEAFTKIQREAATAADAIGEKCRNRSLSVHEPLGTTISGVLWKWLGWVPPWGEAWRRSQGTIPGGGQCGTGRGVGQVAGREKVWMWESRILPEHHMWARDDQKWV